MNKIIPWFRKKLNKLNVFEVPVKEGTVCANENFRTESLKYIDPAYEVESEEDVFLSCLENQEVSQQPYSPTLYEITKNQSQEEKARSFENQKSCHIGLNLSGGDANLPFDEKYIQVFSSSPKIHVQEDENVNGKERVLTTSVPVLRRDGKEHQHFNSLPNLRALIETDCKDNLFKAPNKLDEIGQESQPKDQVPDIKPKNELCVQGVSVEKSSLSPTSEEDFIPEGVFCHYWIGEVLKPLQTSYIFESCFDSGSYGSVCKLKHRVTKVKIAAKIVESKRVVNNEIEIWKTLDHPNILPLIETFQSKDCQVFISPLMENNLWYLVGKLELSFQEIQKYLVDAMRGLNYLHSQNLFHFDIKPDNILIDANGAKLCDFGFLAYTSLNKLTHVSDLGMPLKFRPPECCISLGSDPLIPYEKGCETPGASESCCWNC
ncbi:hypothetical protein JTE90_012575 [Oedothorax gibbosus]|uniref:Protein kinase domain-containing protein n=1 Tax=Oedothorax gibbosus TaxID=931172 RepID=A0AAV6TQH0_9ARAC|nr:hypothetical protein JTE90_012575 [Oedothorax gibbosus]